MSCISTIAAPQSLFEHNSLLVGLDYSGCQSYGKRSFSSLNYIVDTDLQSFDIGSLGLPLEGFE
jgi:hypothetical protein